MKYVLFFLLCVGSIHGQLRPPNPVMLRVQVRLEKDNGKVRDVEIELMDSVGASSAMDSKVTDSEGTAVFSTLTGLHRLRVRGADIVTWEGEIEIMPSEGTHFETIRVKARPSPAGSSAPGEPVPVTRLNIPSAAQNEYNSALQAVQKQDWNEARTRFVAAIALYDKFDAAYYGLGVACWSLNDSAGARSALSKAIALNPKFAAAQRNLARIALKEKNYQEVASLLTQSLSIEPENAWALENAAYADLQLKKYGEAQALAQRVHSLPHTGMANAHMIAAYSLDAQGKKPEAIAEFNLYLKEEPNGPNAQRARDFIARLESGLRPKPAD